MKQRRRRPGADVEIPPAVAEHLDTIVEDVAARLGHLPRGYGRNNIRAVVQALFRRSVAGSDVFLIETFNNNTKTNKNTPSKDPT